MRWFGFLEKFSAKRVVFFLLIIGLCLYFVALFLSKTDYQKENTMPGEGSSGSQIYFNILDADEQENYYRKGSQRFSVNRFSDPSGSYRKYEERILPYEKVIVSYSEYIFEKYEKKFNAKDMNSLTLNLYENVDALNEYGVFIDEEIINPPGVKAYVKEGGRMYFLINLDEEVSKEQVALITSHESIHILQAKSSDKFADRLPKWYLEGMAQYYQLDPDYLVRALDRGKPDDLEQLQDLFLGDQNEQATAYAVSKQYYTYLVDMTSEEFMISLLDSSKYDFADSLTVEIGAPLDSIYHDFLDR